MNTYITICGWIFQPILLFITFVFVYGFLIQMLARNVYAGIRFAIVIWTDRKWLFHKTPDIKALYPRIFKVILKLIFKSFINFEYIAGDEFTWLGHSFNGWKFKKVRRDEDDPR